MRHFIHFPGPAAGASIFLLLFLAAVITACGGSGIAPGRGTAGFTLEVLPTSFEPGGDGQFELKVADLGSQVKLEVIAENAHNLKAAYIDLSYDAGAYTPLGAQATGLLKGGAQQQLIELAVTGEPGVVHHGQVLAKPQSAHGFTGTGVVTTMVFARQAMPHSASVAPDSDRSKTVLSWSANGVLSWRFASTGDYNQDGEVNISDLTRLSIHLDESVAPELFPFESASSVSDGDNNGQVNLADISPIGANYGNSLRKYIVYASLNETDYPAENTDASLVNPVGEVGIETAVGTPSAERLSFSYALASPMNGAFYWVRPADDSGPGTASNSLQYFTPNLSPVADIVPDVASGAAPLHVNFDASGSNDPDGTITKYEFDWDGPGTAYDWQDFGTSAAGIHDFDTPGTYQVNLRVTDNNSAIGTASTTITVNAATPPVADIQADVTTGDAPLDVNFTAAFSTDDVFIVNYEFDFDGDGVFETDNGPNPNAQHTYGSTGQYDAAVRVTDTDNLTDTASITITVTGDPGAPVADIQADTDTGFAPLHVEFDASGSTDDGLITKYEWDWGNDGIYEDESSPFPNIGHDFNTPGTYLVWVKVTDDESKTGTASMMIQVNPPGPSGPQAIQYANPRYGPVGQKVDFDASESYSTDGAIVKYEWDIDGDGTFEIDNGTDPMYTHSFGAAGVYDATVRITDDQAQQDEKIMLVLITPDNSFPPDDSLFVLPSQDHCQPGESVGFEIYCNGTNSNFRYATGLRMTMPQGNTYTPQTFGVGTFGGGQMEGDGVWAMIGANEFLLPSDNFIQITDIGGGMEAIDLNVTPNDGSSAEAIEATGAITHFELTMQVDSTFGFQDVNGVPRTYYQDHSQSPDRFWSNDNLPGLPGVEVQ
jgi:PKD repeat protein